MNHEQLVKYIGGMNVQELTSSTFDDFVRNAKGIFEPVGTKIEIHTRVGRNSLSLNQFGEEAFSNGNRPAWDVFGDHNGYYETIVRCFEVRQGPSPLNNRFLFVEFEENQPHECFGTLREKPWRFAFDKGKALYVAQPYGNGTPECPYENLFLRQ